MVASVKILLISLFLIAFNFSKDENPDNMFTDHRDSNRYEFVEINSLKWMKENLRYKTSHSMTVSDSTENCEGCGEFYSVDDAFAVCPEGWRLPTEKEVKRMFKWHKKQKLSVNQSLSILMCGRVDNGTHAKAGNQNTFWMNAELVYGSISHWHTFGTEQELHRHNVVQAKRQFPVRCVCEVE